MQRGLSTFLSDVLLHPLFELYCQLGLFAAASQLIGETVESVSEEGLRARFRWAPHNLLGHPVGGILRLVGLRGAARRFHDWTLPIAEDAHRKD